LEHVGSPFAFCFILSLLTQITFPEREGITSSGEYIGVFLDVVMYLSSHPTGVTGFDIGRINLAFFS